MAVYDFLIFVAYFNPFMLAASYGILSMNHGLAELTRNWLPGDFPGIFQIDHDVAHRHPSK